MTARLVLRLAPTTRFESESSTELTISAGLEGSAWLPRVTFKQLTPGLLATLKGLRESTKTGQELTAQVLGTDGFMAVGKFRHFLKKLEENALLEYDLFVGEKKLLTLMPASISFRRVEKTVDPAKKYVLSRFAYMRRHENGELVLTAPTAYATLVVHDPKLLAVAYGLKGPRSVEELSKELDLDTDAVIQVLEVMGNVGAVEAVDDSGKPASETRPSLGQWSFPDLLFHASSRMGRHSNPFGATYRNAQKFEGSPIVKPAMSGTIIPLPKPDLEALTRGPSFSEVLEGRRTVRTFGERPITLDQLGELLFRAARIKKMVEEGGVTWRPSPGGGGLHETEIYPLVSNCEGLEKGVYHYNPLEHTLEKLPVTNEADVQQIIEMARIAAMLEQPAQVLLSIAARFQRVQNKYDSVCYSVMAKNTGALYQTVYLVAEAMGLSAVGLGGGDSDLFSKVIGTDYYAETTIGEMLIGSGPIPRPEPLTPPRRMAQAWKSS